MFTVTKTIIFQPKRNIVSLTPNGVEPPEMPPIFVNLEFECDTSEDVANIASIGRDHVAAMAKLFDGHVVFADVARQIFGHTILNFPTLSAVAIQPEPGFQVKYQPQSFAERLHYAQLEESVS